MNKILYISHHREPSGWGQAARDYILAMDSVGIDVVPRAIRPNKNAPEAQLPERILELEQKSLSGSNICIQHLLPHLMDYNGRFDKNIGLFVTETRGWHHSGWSSYLNQMDELWVPNEEMFGDLRPNKVTTPKHLIPHATDVTKYKLDYGLTDLGNANDDYKFYFIGEFNLRKRISAIIHAYFLSFTANDPVTLVLKVNKPGMSPEQLFSEVTKLIESARNMSKLYSTDNYPHIVVMPGYMTKEQIYSLHQTCDCFVNASFGEAWSIPTFDAMGFDNCIISSKCGGPADYLKDYSKKSFVYGDYVPVCGMNETFQQLNTSRETWYHINTTELAGAMRSMYTYGSIRFSENPTIKYSYQNIGERIKEALCI